ncbi:MAG TPA: urease accessory protein UreD [Noviherbaspirillum sp.]
MRADYHHSLPATTTPAEPWQAWLALGFRNDGGTTRLVERSHHGPLRVQKPLYPEGKEICHAIVVHPPGGVVGGDGLDIHACAGESAHALITTPGAAKWYKANGRMSRQDVHLHVGDNATLEWLPQEAIFFNEARVRLDNMIDIGAGGAFIGCDILCFGRTASGEAFLSGAIEQRTSIRRDGRLVWYEQGRLAGDSAAMRSPIGLSGKTVCATLIGVGQPLSASALQAVRAAGAACLDDTGAFGATQMKSVLVARYLGHSSETARRLMLDAWRVLRPLLIGRNATVPRIWNT